MTTPLPKRQQAILDFVTAYHEEHGAAPTQEEIATRFNISKPTAHEHLKALQDKGRLRMERYRHRSIEIVAEGDAEPPARARSAAPPTLPALPVVGRVAAGRPIEAVEEREPQQLMELIPTEGCFALQVTGDSMIEDSIRDGDFVILENRKDPRNGETVVALIDKQEATLKVWRKVGREVRLEPRNAALQPIVVDASRVEVCGVLVGLVRRY
jgi:repressor LexA